MVFRSGLVQRWCSRVAMVMVSSGLLACGGGGGGDSTSNNNVGGGGGGSAVTQSNITLPTSVEVVTTNNN